MKKLAKKQTGGTTPEFSTGANLPRKYPKALDGIKSKKKVVSPIERYKPHGKQEKFDPSEVKKGLILKKPVSDSTYTPSKKSGGAMSKYKSGGQGPANKIGKMVKISKKK